MNKSVGAMIATILCTYASQSPGQQLTSMHSFSGLDGASPAGSLIVSSNWLFGTTSAGGAVGKGTIFSIKSDGTSFATLHSFNGAQDGSYPSGALCICSNALYGTAPSGGLWNNGTLFRLSPDGSAFEVLHYFTGLTDGGAPTEELLLVDSTIYGMANSGGAGGNGIIFKINADGSGFSIVHSFDSAPGPFPPTNSGGVAPRGGLVLFGSTLYGTTFYGGSSGWGTVFKINTDGTGFAVLHDFSGADGASPIATLLVKSRPPFTTLYGTTSVRGTFGSGTIFRTDPAGISFSTLVDFDALGGSLLPPPIFFFNFKGACPAKLVSSGNTLFGTSTQGGYWGAGNVFQLGTDGSGFTVLHDFTRGYGESSTTNMDGKTPNGLILSRNALYGTTWSGGKFGLGTVFVLALPSPNLVAVRSSASVILTWASITTGWNLLSCTNLASPVWEPVVPGPVTVNGQSTVTNSIVGPQRFYILTQGQF